MSQAFIDGAIVFGVLVLVALSSAYVLGFIGWIVRKVSKPKKMASYKRRTIDKR